MSDAHTAPILRTTSRITELSVVTVPQVEDLWLAALKAANRSPATLTTYRSAITAFKQWRSDGDLITVSRGEAYAWVAWGGQRWQPGGVAIRLRSLRALYGWLAREEFIERNPFRGITITVPDDPHLTATDEQFEAMLGRARASRQRHRDVALLTVLVDTGARKNEVASLVCSDVNLADALLTFRVSKTRARTVPLTDRCVVALGRWLRNRGLGDGALWSSPRNPIADPYALIRHAIERHSGGTLTPHSLRRAAAVRALRKGVSVPSIERLFGWSPGSAMVQRYVAAEGQELAIEEAREKLR